MKVRLLALISSAGMILLMSGCALWPFGRAVSAIYPVLEGSPSPAQIASEGESGSRMGSVVTDEGGGWERSILFPERGGEATGPYRDGELVRVRWTIPIQVGRNIRALAGVGSQACAWQDRESPPGQWWIETSEGRRGEAWRVDPSYPSGSRVSSGSRSLGVLAGEEVRRSLRLGAQQNVGWVVVPPSYGMNFLVIEWEGRDASSLLTLQPCIRGWTPMPVEWALSLTHSGSTQVASEDDGTETGGAAITSDAGLSLDQIRSAPQRQSDADEDEGGAEAGGEAQSRTQEAHAIIERELTLLGLPEYDLIRLHQTALAHEAGVASAAFIRGDDEVIRVARMIRRERIDALTLRRDADEVFCQLALRHQMSARALKLWDGEATVPVTYLAEDCQVRP